MFLLGKDRAYLHLPLHQRIYDFPLFFFMNLVTLGVWAPYKEGDCPGAIPL
jgi:hypothetical protein